jgi:tetratricopeptide repeat protein 30
MSSAVSGQRRIAEGQFTSTVYGLIRDLKYDEAIKILTGQLQHFPKNRAALSLIAYCYYHAQDFANAATLYDM